MMWIRRTPNRDPGLKSPHPDARPQKSPKRGDFGTPAADLPFS